MKILHLTWEYPPRIVGGISRHVYYLAQELANLGSEVYIVTLEFPNASFEESYNNVYVYRVKVEFPSYDFLTWVYAFNHFFEKKVAMLNKSFDIIHIHDWLVAPAGISLKYFLKKPLILTLHSLEIGRVGSISNPVSSVISSIEWWSTYEAKKIITTTNFMKQEIINHFKVPENKIEIIFNGINVNGYNIQVDKNEIKRKLGIPEHCKIVLFVGRITEQKGVKYLIEASPYVLKNNSNVRFVIVGDGWQINEIKQRINDLNLNWAIKLTGYVDDFTLKQIIKSADVLVAPSIYEPFGLVALEGMANGIPVIVSNIGGFKEIVEHNVDGLHVNPFNVHEIASAILSVINNEEYAKYLVNNARNKVLKFSWKEAAKRTLEVYKSVLEN
jgi:glycogen(starch) synthase